MAESVYAHDLGSCLARGGGSSPLSPTDLTSSHKVVEYARLNMNNPYDPSVTAKREAVPNRSSIAGSIAEHSNSRPVTNGGTIFFQNAGLPKTPEGVLKEQRAILKGTDNNPTASKVIEELMRPSEQSADTTFTSAPSKEDILAIAIGGNKR